MLKCLAAVAALLIVAGCDQPRMSTSGGLTASCATPAASCDGDHGRREQQAGARLRPARATTAPTGPTAPTATDRHRTARDPHQPGQHRRPHRPHQPRRHHRPHRVVRRAGGGRSRRRPSWCSSTGTSRTSTPAAQRHHRARPPRPTATKGGAQIKASRPHRPRRVPRPTTWRCRCAARTRSEDALVREGVAARGHLRSSALGESQPLVRDRRRRARGAEPAGRDRPSLGRLIGARHSSGASFMLFRTGRGRDARYRAPPAQNPACPIKAPGSHLG